jgi:hypothetical protein
LNVAGGVYGPHKVILIGSITASNMMCDMMVGSCACRLYVVLAASTVGLAIFGAVGAALGGASMLRGSTRVVLGGVLAMAVGA